MLEVKVRLAPGAYTPTVKHLGDAGMDFYSMYDYVIHPHTFQIVITGVSVEFPEGFVGLLKPKSKNDHLIGAGVVEYTYQGDILFKVFNPLTFDRVIAKGDPIGQMIFIKNESPTVFVTTEPRIKTVRGSTGGIVSQVEGKQLKFFGEDYESTIPGIYRWD